MNVEEMLEWLADHDWFLALGHFREGAYTVGFHHMIKPKDSPQQHDSKYDAMVESGATLTEAVRRCYERAGTP